MSPQLLKAIMSKKLFIKKGANVQGSVRIHFPDPGVQDIVLSNWEPVDVFGRIKIDAEQIRLSNLEELVVAGDVQIVRK